MLVSWLVGLLIGCMAIKLPQTCPDWLTYLVAFWLVNCLVACLLAWFRMRFSSCPKHVVVGWLTCWLNACSVVWLVVCSMLCMCLGPHSDLYLARFRETRWHIWYTFVTCTARVWNNSLTHTARVWDNSVTYTARVRDKLVTYTARVCDNSVTYPARVWDNSVTYTSRIWDIKWRRSCTLHVFQLQFLMDTYDVSGITNTLDTVRERTLSNLKWLDKNFDTIKQWLASKGQQRHAIPCNTILVRYSAIQCNIVPYTTIQCNVVRYSTIRCSAM